MTSDPNCDRIKFVSDVTIPDGASLNPGFAFTKTWRIKNAGTCTWTPAYRLAFHSGDPMGGPASVSLPRKVAPGQVIDISVNLVAPGLAGTYKGAWQMRNAEGKPFGSGLSTDGTIWVQIKVNKTALEGTHYDFVANACAAEWSSPAGNLPCPGREGDKNGFVLRIKQPRLEDGSTYSLPGLLTFPQNVENGSIQGIYPPLLVQPGDRFRSIVNCEYGAKACLLLFRLDYQIGNGPIFGFWSIGEVNEGKYFEADVDLSPFAGEEIKFVLQVQAFGPATDDRALWVAPRIIRKR
jgi:hypothetical protein